MKSLFRLVILVLLVVGWGLAALSLHVVRTRGSGGGERVLLIPKQRLHYADTYVDARAWTLEELGTHPALAQRIIESGKVSFFTYITGEEELDVDALTDSIRSAVERAREAAQANVPSSGKERSAKKSSSGPAATAGNWWDLIKS